jgi:hypothetical protein
MLKTRSWIALSIVAALFFLTGVEVFTYAQMANESSMGGNMTNATTGNATSGTNMTGNISGVGNPVGG